MTDNTSNDLGLDEEFDHYLSIALYAPSGGFSKGTANVSAHDVQKLKGLLKYYAKKPHPFTACVRDNTKRFGAHTDQYCAVLKDLIVGNTKWRKGNQSGKGKNLSEETLRELYELDIPEGFSEWLSEVTEPGEEMNLAVGDVAWNASTSWSNIKGQIQNQLNGGNEYASEYGAPGLSFWVDDVSGSEALVCGGSQNWIVPFSVDKSGEVTVADEEEWTKVAQEWVEQSVNFADQIGAEMFFAEDDAPVEVDTKKGVVWKPILREGKWLMSPGPGQKPQAKPITVVKDGLSDGNKLIISIEDIKNNFDSGAVEHVTIPTSHADRVLENTGFVKDLRISTDAKGRTVLEAAHDFTEPDVREKALRGTIANTSAGILFDYVNKETGKKNSAVLGHVALTNHPWLTDMKPFGVMASENVQVMAFSEESETIEGGSKMEEVEVTTPEFLTKLGLSEDEAASRLARYEELERKDRQYQVDAKVAKWQEEKKSPAVVTAAKALLSGANVSETILNLSEEGKQVGLSVEDIVDRLVAASPELALAEDVVTDKDTQGDRPDDDAENENAEAKLSQEEKALATSLFLSGKSEEEAIKEAKKRLASE